MHQEYRINCLELTKGSLLYPQHMRYVDLP